MSINTPELHWRTNALERRADKAEARLDKVEDEADDIRTVNHRLRELESTVKWLVRSNVALATIVAVASVIQRGF